MSRHCILIITMWAIAGIASAEEPVQMADLIRQLQELDHQVILRGPVTRQPMAAMLSRAVEAELREANRQDLAEWDAIRTKQDWEQTRQRRLTALGESLGKFPVVSPGLKVRVARTIQGDGFFVDNLIFESRPGVLVTANLYRPAQPTASMPGIIVCHSHHRSKESGARQAMGATWARAGCVVYVPDHLGHGERRQHPFRTAANFDQPFRLEMQDYYFRYDAGIQLHLVGDSLIGWLVWDLQRGLDVLLRQTGVDSKRIVMISEPAGGGDVAAVTAALDERISGVMVNNFGGPEPENGYPLPKDAETWFPYTSSGSWESTRNLRLSARDGFLPWMLVASIAPRRLIYYHEFYWDREQDPVWRRLEKIYGFYEAADSLQGLAGKGFVVGTPPMNTHWIPYSRELLYPTLRRWFQINSPSQEYDRLLPETDLLCLNAASSAVATERSATSPLHDLWGQLADERGAKARRELDKLSPVDRTEQLKRRWAALLGQIDLADPPVVRLQEQQPMGNLRVERVQLGTEPGIIVPVLLLIPSQRAAASQIVVAVAQAGKEGFLRHRSEQIAPLLAAGHTVCLLDLRGTGETDPGDGRGRSSAASSLSSSELMLGQTPVGARLRDLRQVLRYLRQRDDFQHDRVVLWGDNFAPVNSPDERFVVPHDAPARPEVSEPLGGMLALLAALFDDKIHAVYVHGGLMGFREVLKGPCCYVPHDVVIPGVLTVGDLCDVAAAIAPRPLRLDRLVDGFNRPASLEQILRDYATARESYRRASAPEQLEITGQGPSIARWLSGE